MKRFAYSLLLLLAPCVAFAATPEQMEQARAIVYKQCLRFMNNGSGYLDDKANPKSVSELEKYLKPKEKENIGKLKAISIPPQSEYAAWDSEKFNEFWTGEYMDKTPKFNAKGDCRKRAANGIKQIKVTVVNPQPAPAPAPKKDSVAAPAAQPLEEQHPDINQQPAADYISEEIPEGDISTEDLDRQAAQIDLENVPVQPVEEKKSNSNTASIIVLIILVLVVVALVGYALNVMKKNKSRQSVSMRSNRYADSSYSAADTDFDRKRGVDTDTRTVQSDPYEESAFAAYSGYDTPTPSADDPREKEIERLRSEIAALKSRIGPAAASIASTYTPSAPRRNAPRIIYLAQANADGVFTRADARYNMGNSIFKLVTTDGVSGSFSVIEDPTVFELALMMPADFLVNACTGRNLQLSQGARIIVNEASGTAIFEDGRWRVSRKAQIRYAN